MNKNRPSCRRDIINQAIIECLNEMYICSQPSITWEEAEKLSRNNPDRRIYEEHYLSQDNYKDILDKYIKMYKIDDDWSDDIDVLIDYLNVGGSRDRYIEPYTDELGGYYPGRRGYEKVEPIRAQIQSIIKNEIGEAHEECVDKITKSIMDTINDCKQFYATNRDSVHFRLNVSNFSPSSSFESVKEFYKDNPDVIIYEMIDFEEDEDY